ncbi:C40 family peptidase [Paenibacillus sp. 2TAB19]|uniref:C40 family peptidase n=1 Tax=Paenibacillus sp. 2TAB19 TaxID=3233003 RepID=UPI003F9DBE3C
MKKKIIVLSLALSLSATGVAFGAASSTKADAVAKYNKYINADSYVKDELYNVADFRAKYAGQSETLAYKLVERAIWYMENGYFVYGHGSKAYAKYGYEDCSGFTSLVYGDFGYSITETSKNYDSVGTKVAGVGKKKVNGKWQLTGIENLRIGDLLTWQTTDHIMHVAIYMGTNRDGQPVVIGTRSDGNPTALGTVDSWSYWWGENFHSARRVLPDSAFTGMAGKTEQAPVIPKSYILPPQKSIPKWDSPIVQQPDPTPQQPEIVNPGEEQSDKQYVVTKKGWVSLKASASSSSATVGRLELGQKAELVKKVNSYWYQVKVDGKTVYITTSSTYTDVIGGSSSGSTTPQVQKKDYVTTVKGWVSLKASASSSSATVGRLELGQKAELVKKTNSYWYEVKVDGKSVYITTSATYTKVITE